MAGFLSRDSPYDARTGVNVCALPAFPQDRGEVRTTSGASGAADRNSRQHT